MNKLLYLLTVSLVFGSTIFAQKTMNEDFRKTAPAPLAPRSFAVAKPFETTLKNGLKVVVIEEKRLPIVSYRLAFRTGDINDPQGSTGLTTAMTQMLSQGTKTRTSKQIAEDIERLGASLSASSSADNTIVAASALAGFGSDILKLMADMTLNPAFPQKELDLYKQNTIEGLKYQRSQPDFLASEQMSRILYGKHPYSVASPTEDDINKLTHEKLAAFHKQVFIPNNATMIVVGDVNKDNLIKDLETLFGGWQKGSVTNGKFDAPPTAKEITMTIVDRKGSAQSNIVISNLAIPRNHPDYFPVLVMNQVLGAGASSRLFMNLREEKGYTYGAYSSFDQKRLAGAFEATAEVRTPVTGDSLKEFFKEMKSLRDKEVSATELQDAKSYLTGVFPIRAETQEGLTNLIVAQQLYDLPADYLQTYRDKINAVTAADVQRVANKYVTPDKAAIVIVGDAEEILKQVKPYSSKIEIFDTEGKMQDIANYGKPTEKPSVDVTGKWDLTIDFQGQSLPVTLTLKQDGEKISGTLSSMLGEGKISDGKVSGNKFNGIAAVAVQGQTVDLTISGTVEGEEMKGTLTAPMVPTPLPFKGTKAK